MTKLRFWIWTNIALNGLVSLRLIEPAKFFLALGKKWIVSAPGQEELGGPLIMALMGSSLVLVGLVSLVWVVGGLILDRRVCRKGSCGYLGYVFCGGASLWLFAFIADGFKK